MINRNELVGKKIIIIRPDVGIFDVGAVAVVEDVESDGSILADFDQPENTGKNNYDQSIDHKWYVGAYDDDVSGDFAFDIYEDGEE